MTGHHYRVLYLAMSPDGESIVTGAGDETLRFWNVFSKARSQKVCTFYIAYNMGAIWVGALGLKPHQYLEDFG